MKPGLLLDVDSGTFFLICSEDRSVLSDSSDSEADFSENEVSV